MDITGIAKSHHASFKKYIILWLSQGVSGLGSSMTGFALGIVNVCMGAGLPGASLWADYIYMAGILIAAVCIFGKRMRLRRLDAGMEKVMLQGGI